MNWKRARKSHKGKQDPIVRAQKQADLEMLELSAAAGEIDLKYLNDGTRSTRCGKNRTDESDCPR
ncbi:hypothetical protein PL9631_910026 [Planktothrix paucivesiculata PCC 9631]|uniref:Uncharacterized protein n=1 Tax=Planktothrix paucivesiculata PCC 9631 TaxID=671071 RepID=A0A7Z9BZR7_9CYAN|nr:hypothetical protein PL9631_910026 [Planktothrix paucivesiculata PCC 9631]